MIYTFKTSAEALDDVDRQEPLPGGDRLHVWHHQRRPFAHTGQNELAVGGQVAGAASDPGLRVLLHQVGTQTADTVAERPSPHLCQELFVTTQPAEQTGIKTCFSCNPCQCENVHYCCLCDFDFNKCKCENSSLDRHRCLVSHQRGVISCDKCPPSFLPPSFKVCV